MAKVKAAKAEDTLTATAITERVRERYSVAAQQVQSGGGALHRGRHGS
jgi:hypothetical protein